jgi:hypothetical protein
MLESFLPHHSISAEDTLPLNKSKIFTVSLKLKCTLTFTFLFGHHLPFGRQLFTKFVAGKTQQSHNNLNTTDDNLGPLHIL